MLVRGLQSVSISLSLCVLRFVRGQAAEAGWSAQSQMCLCTGILDVLAKDNTSLTITPLDVEQFLKFLWLIGQR